MRSISRRSDVGGLVALEAREHRRRHRQDEEPRAEQVGGELDRRLRVRLGGGQVSAAHRDERSKRRDRHDRQRRAPRARLREDLVGAAQGRVETVGDREGGQGQVRPVLAAMGLEREARRDRALREVDRGGRRAQVQHLVHRQRGERGGLQHVACRAARVSQGGDRRLGLAPGRRRRGAEAQQRDLELLACRLPGREPLLGAAQDRRSFGGAAGEEEHAAELDRRRGDRGRVLAALDDLRQRGDRLRCAGAGVRLAELEQDRGALVVSGRLLEGAGEQGGRAGCVAQRQRVAGGVPQQCDRRGVGGRLGVHDVRRDLAGGRSALAQDRRRGVVQPLAFGGRQVAVDRRAQDRMGEADRAAGFHDAGGDQRRHRRLQLGAGESGQSRGVAHLRAVAERAQRAGERGGRRRQPRQTEQHRVGDAARDDRADIGRGGRGGLEAARRRLVEQLADEERVAARHLDARAHEPIVRLAGQPGGDERTDRRPRQGRRAQQLHGGIGDERRRLGRQRGIERPGGEDQPQRLPLEPARDERERARRRRVAPLQVVDHEHERRIGGEVRGKPVQPVLPRVAGIAGGWAWRRRLGAGAGAPVSTSAASAAAPASQRSRSPASASSSVRSNSWRTTPNGNPCSSSVARALSTRTPRSEARTRAASSSRDFPIPAAPSMTRTPPARWPTARSAARTRSSSCSRSSSAAGWATAGWSMRPPIEVHERAK